MPVDATPAELERVALRGQLLSVACDAPMLALPLLERAPGVREVALHALVDVELDRKPVLMDEWHPRALFKQAAGR